MLHSSLEVCLFLSYLTSEDSDSLFSIVYGTVDDCDNGPVSLGDGLLVG